MLPIKNKFLVPEVPLSFGQTSMVYMPQKNGNDLYVTASYSSAQSKLVLLDRNGLASAKSLGEGMFEGGFLFKLNSESIVFGKRHLVSYDVFSGKTDILKKNLFGENCFDHPWGGGVVDDYIIYGGSEKKTPIVVYDPRSKKVKLTIENPPKFSYYVYNAMKTPDNKILITTSFPRGGLIIVDTEKWSSKGIYLNKSFNSNINMSGCFLDNKTYFFNGSKSSYLLSYPSFRLIREIKWPANTEFGKVNRQNCIFNGKPLFWDFKGCRFYTLNDRFSQMQRFSQEPIKCDRFGDIFFTECNFVLNDHKEIIGVTGIGDFFRMDLDGNILYRKDVVVPGVVNAWTHLLLNNKKKSKLYGSAHMVQDCWELDLNTGKGRGIGPGGPGGGQVNCMAGNAKTNEIFMASYSTCTLMKYNANKRDLPWLIKTVGFDQSRPLQNLLIDDELWVISSSRRGVLGGALICLNTKTNKVKTWTSIFESQVPQSMLCDENSKTLIITLKAFGEVAETKVKTSGILLFDLLKKKVKKYWEPIKGASCTHSFLMLENGFFLVQDNLPMKPDANLWLLNYKTLSAYSLGQSPVAFREIVKNEESKDMWGTSTEGLGRVKIDLEQKTFSFKVEHRFKKGMAKYLMWKSKNELVTTVNNRIYVFGV